MVKLRQQTRHLRVFLPKHGISTKEIGMSNFHMHYGPLELASEQLLGQPPFHWYMDMRPLSHLS